MLHPRPSAFAGLSLLFAAAVILGANFALANHIAPHTCGVKQSSFARICRAGAYNSCIHAAARGVKGFSTLVCAERLTACRSCLAQLRACIAKIGHAKRMDYNCDECTGKFSRCIGKRYPQIKS